MLKDLRYGIRVLFQTKGWTAVVALSLAVGIGANAAIFTAVNGLLLRKLAVGDPDSLVRIRWAGENDMMNSASDYGFTGRTVAGDRVQTTFSYPMYQHFRSANQTLVSLAASVPMSEVTVVIDGRAETASALLTTGNYYQMLGVTARLGRTLVPADDGDAETAVATISARFWRTRFGASNTVIGKAIRVNNVAITIVGVTPEWFTGTQRVTGELHDLALPLKLDAQIGVDGPRLNDPTYWWVQMTGRLKPGITFDQVRGNFEGIFQGQARAGMDAHLASLPVEDRNRSDNLGRTAVPRLVVDSGRRGVYDTNPTQTTALAILGAVAALVLLLVCANVANLLLARAASRQREISVRLSMGATRSRVIRQLLTESLVLACLGGVLGMLIARWTQSLLPPPVGGSTTFDWRVLVFVSAITAAAGIVFGIAPALRATKVNVGASLKDDSRSTTTANTALARFLLVAQVAISIVLLVGAGLFLRTLNNLQTVDVGFDPQNLVFVRVNTDGSQLDAGGKFRFFQEGLDRLGAVPGVRSATVSRPTLMSGNVSGTTMYVDGRVYPRGRRQGEATVQGDGNGYSPDRDDINRVVVAPGYFVTMGIPLVGGRNFTGGDTSKSPKVAIINQAAARKFFPNENPIGRRFGGSVETTGETEIVGVVRDARYNSLREAPPATVYIPHLQTNPDDLVFSIRTAVEPSRVMSAVRAAVSDANPVIPIVTVETQLAQLERRYSQEKVFAQAYVLFGSIALFVAAIGLFGLMSYSVSRRTREIGIRMAMGARREQVLGLVLRESMLLVVVGIVIGVAAALGTGRFVASQLFGLEPTDLTTMLSAVAVMLIVSAAAGYLPARRATRVDPMVALRYE